MHGVLNEQTMNGAVYVFTGNGKGKTTSAFGLATAAASEGKKVLLCQFIKGHYFSELNALKRFAAIHVEQFGLGLLKNNTASVKDTEAAAQGLTCITAHMNSGEYDMIILDEANVAVKYGLISEKDLIRLIEIKPGPMIMVITGRYATPEIIKKADHAVEMIPVKHYFQKGIKARVGIEK